MSVLKAENITKVYGDKRGGLKVRALDKFSIKVEKGEFVGVMGPSGSGKSTLLNILATIDTPSSGELFINGVNLAELDEKKAALFRRKELGFIFQDFNLLDSLSIKENIILPLVLERTRVKEIEERLNSISEILNIKGILEKRPYETSGGQQQRAACARALIHNPTLILADEPTGNLDSKASQDVMEALENLNNEKKTTIMMVTHDPFAASFCKRIVMIKDGKHFLEIVKGSNRGVFFKEIMDALTVIGGRQNDLI
ncbi:putative ABC transport system ATP-binding protein [Clostridium acetobutylicum]|uniref:ABC-type transport system, ATPase component n=1 Tax=Clostridium acetobutylicum (strain ATCC 824 / DSM 792 / JCM 1419 / IAM 19013 / LMG 5710 / NBRC 13948 / NRRL B-527 / VKM B-1787 / 2291 / W) TaxID=272562 RepID=Q97IX2_CLOAB|nr:MULTISPECIES: ABC transporter ATP-binding protein [Clostridium]AAK79485.1 ABC-type transport system, ATPase component [Clostridium acetobutylicum ATCC 824]ADZ20570.1 ABC-type transport system, ATPase component [Clostridium acetobutylicum EA 2018]AEI31850.1 ABC-type transport system, ATPase component [Clostridium acetobutylicum DSM 1731]AWV81270.1 ABC transporter ATP-binding protein [Clostridium acetobutylicum]MBC2392904.1 ABC transporter ATP-binding protein [Clostridium acetobutylicum]